MATVTSKGAHSFFASNTTTPGQHSTLAGVEFEIKRHSFIRLAAPPSATRQVAPTRYQRG